MRRGPPQPPLPLPTPVPACRIRLVSDPTYASGMAGCASRLLSENGIIGGFYAGFIPILFKQIPYTMAKFAVQGKAAESIYAGIGSEPSKMSKGGNVCVSLGSGVIAGVAAAIISHPADSLLSKVNKAGAGGSGGLMSRLSNIAAEEGFVALATTGLFARCAMIGTRAAAGRASVRTRPSTAPPPPRRHADCRPVRRLRHRHGHGGREEVPLHRPQEPALRPRPAAVRASVPPLRRRRVCAANPRVVALR